MGEPEEVYLVPANTARCFLCNPTVARFVSHLRDGSWTLCSTHMREATALGNVEDEAGSLRPLPRTPGT